MAWLRGVPRAEQFTSAVVVGDLFKGAYRSPDATRHLRNIETRVLPVLTVLPYDVDVARAYGALSAQLEETGQSGSPSAGLRGTGGGPSLMRTNHLTVVAVSVLSR